MEIRVSKQVSCFAWQIFRVINFWSSDRLPCNALPSQRHKIFHQSHFQINHLIQNISRMNLWYTESLNVAFSTTKTDKWFNLETLHTRHSRLFGMQPWKAGNEPGFWGRGGRLGCEHKASTYYLLQTLPTYINRYGERVQLVVSPNYEILHYGTHTW